MTFRRDVAWNFAGAAAPIVVGALSVPYLIRQLGVERFGVLTLLWAIVGYASLFDLGLGRAATQQIAARIARGALDDIRSIARTAIALTAVIGLLFGVLFTGSAGILATRLLNVSPGIVVEVRNTLMIVGCGIPLATLSNGMRGVAEAYRRFPEVNVAKIVTGTAIFLLPLLAALIGHSGLVGIAIMLVLARSFGVLMFWRVCRALPYQQMPSRELPFREKKAIFLSGLWMSVSSIVNPILVNLDRFFIANILGAPLVAYYTAPFELLVRLLILPGAIGSSLLPRYANDHISDRESARLLYSRLLVITGCIMGILCGLALLLARPVMTLAVSPDFASHSMPVVQWLLLGIFLNGLANVPYSALHAVGDARFTGSLHVVELAIYVPTLIVLIKLFGLSGAAMAWTARAAADFLAMSLRYRHLHDVVSPAAHSL